MPQDRPAGWRRIIPRRRPRLVGALCWAYAAALAALWLLLYAAADRWWVGTVVMYGPRWVWGLPLIVLLPAAAFLGRRASVWPLLLAAALLLGPVMQLCLPWRTAMARAGGAGGSAASAAPLRLRVLTCNVDASALDADALAALVAETRPDVVALQAWSNRHQRKVFGRQRGPGGWYVHRAGELFLASRHPIVDARVSADPGFAHDDGTLARYDLAVPGVGVVPLLNLHLSTPRHGLEAVIRRGRGGAPLVRENIAMRRRQSESAGRWAQEAGPAVVVAGDFNMPADSLVYRQYWSHLDNAFTSSGTGFGHTHFTRRTAVRIDHVLAGPGWRCRRSWVGPDVGSAHRPVLADLVWAGPDGSTNIPTAPSERP